MNFECFHVFVFMSRERIRRSVPGLKSIKPNYTTAKTLMRGRECPRWTLGFTATPSVQLQPSAFIPPMNPDRVNHRGIHILRASLFFTLRPFDQSRFVPASLALVCLSHSFSALEGESREERAAQQNKQSRLHPRLHLAPIAVSSGAVLVDNCVPFFSS